MDLVNIIEAYINTNNNIDDVQLYVIELIEQLEFLYDICHSDDESDEEPFTPEELEELNNIEVGKNGEFYFIH
tara:strand:- start:665 stop:883 length:219 start_codon:yes stop_codon:yes gene_type:complete